MDTKNIVLVGFMGSGKTAVGRVLAEWMGRNFIDCDQLIEAEDGRDIPRIFAESGERYFRQLEQDVIAKVTKTDNQVISTGGGAVLNDENMRNLRSTGRLIGLLVCGETVCRRLEGDLSRPLLNGDDKVQRIQSLLSQRDSYYRQADIVIDTDDFDGQESVAKEVITRLERLHDLHRYLTVELGDRSYPITIGTGILAQLGKELEQLKINDPLLVVTNPTVGALYLDTVKKSLSSADRKFFVATVPDGEEYKSLEQAEYLYDKAVEAGLERRSAILALGGGVIGDLTGFVAATYLRGVSFIQLPTTLLAQVDSSVGGKVAVNHPKGKNLIGCFYQPKVVVADLDTFRTLEPRDYASGLAEVVKSAIIRDYSLFEYLEAEQEAVCRRDPFVLAEIVERVCRIKAEVVVEDEREEGLRAILNLGHTIGHALEAITEYRQYRHGEAVSIGINGAFEIALRMDLCSIEELNRVKRLLTAYSLPIDIPGLPIKPLKAALALDKKVLAGRVGFVLPRGLGKVDWDCSVPEAVLNEALLCLGAVEGDE